MKKNSPANDKSHPATMVRVIKKQFTDHTNLVPSPRWGERKVTWYPLFAHARPIQENLRWMSPIMYKLHVII